MFDKIFFFTSLFSTCFWIRDPRSGIRDPGWVKIRIRDKHPGSATLPISRYRYPVPVPSMYVIAKSTIIDAEKTADY
jgi:hypothetical protein